MMITTLLVAAVMAPQARTAANADLVCPVMGDKVTASSKAYEYNGLRMAICCGGCGAALQKDPANVLKKAQDKGWLVAESLFDPVDGVAVRARLAKGTIDWQGVRYYFTSADNAATFKRDPKKYAVLSKKAALICPVSMETIPSYSKAAFSRVVDGTRYYICCGGCIDTFDANPAEYAAKLSGKLADPVVVSVKE